MTKTSHARQTAGQERNGRLEQVRPWFGWPLWDMEPADADVYFGKVLRITAKGTRLSRAQALKTLFLFLDLFCTCQDRVGCR
ncbi:hypothetical protein [Streptosporangium sp. 'caverna']|uniref:hypothetical protein n=1 Tax=Streptosporangium sp. 'caverna' TaxID=2202249 RepID=UPI001955033F|nr:hypothetical protein [Streptosporangium sp. 'caverna']